MANTTHAVDLLAALPEAVPGVCALVGSEPFLKRQVIQHLRQHLLGDEGDLSYSSFEGANVRWAEVLDELATVAMFGPARRLVVIADADGFVSTYRQQLEDYAARPARTGILVLAVGAMPSNTRLYKAIVAGGLLVECSTPPPARLAKWLVAWAKQMHQAQLALPAAEDLIETTGTELGLLDQEIARLALLAGESRKITAELVGQSAGSWRTKTTWDMLDAALAGQTDDAMRQLDRLLSSGEAPLGILAQIASSLRRFAAASRLVMLAEAQGRRPVLREVLEQVGVRPFVMQKSESQLRRLGRRRASHLYQWLLEADLGMKGDSDVTPRLILERLLLRVAAQETPSR